MQTYPCPRVHSWICRGGAAVVTGTEQLYEWYMAGRAWYLRVSFAKLWYMGVICRNIYPLRSSALCVCCSYSLNYPLKEYG